MPGSDPASVEDEALFKVQGILISKRSTLGSRSNMILRPLMNWEFINSEG